MVTLDRQLPENGQIMPGPILPRELIRQAVLVAARDELGASTRDEVLGEPTKAAGSLHLVPIVNRSNKGYRAGLSIDGKPARIWNSSLAAPAWPDELADAAVDAELLSRGSLVELLKQQGVAGPANKQDPDGKVSPAAAVQLEHLEPFAQLSAIRLIHAQIHDQGESPERLAALARGYANFSSLTRFIWSGESRAAAARALLYGQRAVTKFPDSPAALSGRLYAYAVVGLTKPAVDDLAMLDKRFPKAERPTWVDLAGALAKYDVEHLLTAGEKPAAAPLATYFAYLTVQNSNAQAAVLNFAALALTKTPDCQQLMARINDDTGPGITQPAAATFSRTLGTLDKLPGMDANIVKLLPQLRRPGAKPNGRLAMIDTLNQDGETDRGEPSWHVTARLIEDVTFMDFEAEAMHITFKLSQPPTGFIDEIWPLVEKHRYAPLMAGYRNVATAGQAAALAGMAHVRIDDPMLVSMSEVSQHWLNAQRPVTEAGLFQLLMGTDALACDEELKGQIFQFSAAGGGFQPMGGFGAFSPEKLEKLSPDSPMLMASKIKNNWSEAEPHLNDWLKQVGDHPSVTLAASEAYFHAHRQKEAIDMLERYLAVSPDASAFETLANSYLEQHDEKNWLATLQRGLQQPAAGLEHARTNEKIAQYFIAQKRYQEALPFAESAADSYSAWGLDLAALVNERLGNWDRAEALVRGEGENYSRPASWLEWCVRTGHGDLAGAKKHAAEGIAAAADHTDRESRTNRLAFDMLAEEWADAEKQAAETTQDLADPWAGLHGVMLASARHDDAARDQFFGWMLDPKHPFRMPDGSGRPLLVQTARLIRDAAKAKTAKFDPAKVDRIASGDSIDAPNVYYYVGRYAEIGDELEQAKAYYEKSLDCTATKSNKSLAAMRLRVLNAAPATQP
ncbi:MAG: hypothetical protein JWM57_2765 [Phycisphaerales bacterium]|nr:hypothetical protein [Phycisphaerales bacterium]